MILRAMAGSLTFTLLAIASAGAQTAAPTSAPVAPTSAPVASPAAPAVPSGFSATAHFIVFLPVKGSPIKATVRIGVAQRDQLTRIDVLSIESALLPIPIRDISLVIDRSANLMTFWNTRTQTYATQAFLPANILGGGRSPSPATTRTPSARPRKPERSLLAGLDLLTFNMRLTGHTMTSGIPSTGIAFDLKGRRHGSALVGRFTGTTQLADAYPFFPVLMQATFLQSAGTPQGSLSYAIDAFTTTLPSADMFVVPADYRRVPIPAVIVGRALPSPAPIPSATP